MKLNNKFIYLHIPKTGGVSFRQVLENHCNVKNILHVRNAGELLKHSDETLKPYQLVHGHFNFYYMRHLLTFRRITSLRDPVSQCLSTYNFFCSLDADAPTWNERNRNQIKTAQQSSLEELIEHPDNPTSRTFNNLQTRMLSGLADDATPLTSQHLKMAIEQLESFDFIALNEQLDESKLLLCMKFGLYPPSDSTRLNQSRLRTQQDPQTLKKLLTANELDNELIETVKTKGLYRINKLEKFYSLGTPPTTTIT